MSPAFARLGCIWKTGRWGKLRPPGCSDGHTASGSQRKHGSGRLPWKRRFRPEYRPLPTRCGRCRRAGSAVAAAARRTASSAATPGMSSMKTAVSVIRPFFSSFSGRRTFSPASPSGCGQRADSGPGLRCITPQSRAGVSDRPLRLNRRREARGRDELMRAASRFGLTIARTARSTMRTAPARSHK